MIKQPEEIALMAISGQLLAQVFHALDRLPLEGRSTLELNAFVERMIVDELDARPASKGQYGFEFVLNASIDDVVCHGVPSADDVLRSGQIVNLDITLEKNGFIADSSTTIWWARWPIRRGGWCRPPIRRCGKASLRCGPVRAWAISGRPLRGMRVTTAKRGQGVLRPRHRARDA